MGILPHDSGEIPDFRLIMRLFETKSRARVLHWRLVGRCCRAMRCADGTAGRCRLLSEVAMVAMIRVGVVMMTVMFGLAATVSAQAAAVERGAAIYAAQKCSMCHALDGKGPAKGPLDGVGSKLSAAEIREWIVNPAEMTKKANATRKPAMRAYPNLPKEDLDALVAFMVSKKKG